MIKLRMTPTRKKLFAKYDYDLERGKRSLLEMPRHYDRLLKELPLTFGSDVNRNVDMILDYMLRDHVESAQKDLEKMAARQATRDRLFVEFLEVFGVSLSNYWRDARFGFDIVRFDEVVIKSGDNSMKEEIRHRYGERAAKMIDELIK